MQDATPSQHSPLYRLCLASLAFAMVLTALSVSSQARGFKFRSAGKSIAAGSAKAGNSTGKFVAGMIAARAVSKATRQNLHKVYDLPKLTSNELSDGRHFHIGRLSRMLFGAKLVGYVSPTEYVSLSSEQLGHILFNVGFNDVAEFEAHLARTPPADAVADAEDGQAPSANGDAAASVATATTKPGLSAGAMATLAALIIGLIGFFVVAAVRGRRSTPVAAVAPGRAARVVGTAAVRASPAAAPPGSRIVEARPTRPTAGTAANHTTPAPNSGASGARRAPRDLRQTLAAANPALAR